MLLNTEIQPYCLLTEQQESLRWNCISFPKRSSFFRPPLYFPWGRHSGWICIFRFGTDFTPDTLPGAPLPFIQAAR